MHEAHEELTAAAEAVVPPSQPAPAFNVLYRQDLAFPCFDDEMLQRLAAYGQEEEVPDDTLLYTYGDRDTDMFVILGGQIESRLLVKGGGSKCFRMLTRGEFTGELIC